MLKKILSISGVAITLIVILMMVAMKVSNYKADDIAMNIYIANDENLEFINDDSKIGFIIYPGGNVEEIAYIRLAKLLYDEGYTGIVESFPFDMGVFGIDKADKTIEKYPNIEKWVIIGHSLGGVSAGLYAIDNKDKVDGLVFLASYSTEDLKDTDIKVLSFIGSNDEVLKMEGYSEALSNYNIENNNFTEIVIQGGNHSGFANYGDQKGDGENTIGFEKQQEIVINEILKFTKDYILE